MSLALLQVRSRTTCCRVVCLCALLLSVGSATTSGSGSGCSLSTSNIGFGTYDVFAGADNDTVGTLTYSCSGSVPTVSLTLTGGSYSAGSRTMSTGGSTDKLRYSLYLDAARTRPWGDGNSGTSTYSAAPVASGSYTLQIYGRIPRNQDVITGSYQDSVTATINY